MPDRGIKREYRTEQYFEERPTVAQVKAFFDAAGNDENALVYIHGFEPSKPFKATGGKVELVRTVTEGVEK